MRGSAAMRLHTSATNEQQMRQRLHGPSVQIPSESEMARNFKNLDLFTKMNSPTESQNRVRTKSGGIFSFISILFIVWLVLSNTFSFLFPKRSEHLIVDKMFDQKLEIEFDIEFHAIACLSLNIDVMDATGGQQMHVHKNIIKQRLDLSGHKIGEPIHQKNGFITNLLYYNDKPLFGTNLKMLPIREGCRIKGKLNVQKVAGNFHLALGDAQEINGRHIHQFLVSDIGKFNASHTIHAISFGKPFPNKDQSQYLSAPLIGVTKTVNARSGSGIFQYNFKVIPTEYISSSSSSSSSMTGAVSSVFSNLYSYEYNYKYIYVEPPSSAASSSLSPGKKKKKKKKKKNSLAQLPGVFFVYKINPYMLQISDIGGETCMQFVINLCAIAGGVFAMSSLLDSIMFHCILFTNTAVNPNGDDSSNKNRATNMLSFSPNNEMNALFASSKFKSPTAGAAMDDIESNYRILVTKEC